MLGTYHVRCSGGDLVRKDRTSYELQVSLTYEERIKMHMVVGIERMFMFDRFEFEFEFICGLLFVQ